MRVLIVEDHPFSAYCLQRLLESTDEDIQVLQAKFDIDIDVQVDLFRPDVVVLDGHLDNNEFNGPALADRLWKKYLHLQIIAWTDSEAMRIAFQSIFHSHNKIFNDQFYWPKTITLKRVANSLAVLKTFKSAENYTWLNKTAFCNAQHI